MEKMKKMLLNINFAMISFTAYAAKVFTFGASLPDCLILAVISGLYAYTMYLDSQKPIRMELNDKVQTQLNEVQKNIRDISMKSSINKQKLRW